MSQPECEPARYLSSGTPIRHALAALATLGLMSVAAAEQDRGPALVELFAKTCARQPARPTDMQRFTVALGFVSDGGPITTEMESAPNIDLLYMGRFTKAGENVSLTAHFSGPADDRIVICSLNSTGVSADALPDVIEKSLKARERSAQAVDDSNRRRWSWRIGAATDVLEASAWLVSPQRASISMTYRLHK